MKKRIVEDILYLEGPVAYVIDQKKKRHQAVCPFCAKDVGKPKHLPEGTTVIELYDWLLDIIMNHVMSTSCGEATEMQIEVAHPFGGGVKQ